MLVINRLPLPDGATILKSLVRVDNLSAQRPLGRSIGKWQRGEIRDLSRRLSRFYKRNLDQRKDESSSVKGTVPIRSRLKYAFVRSV